MDPEHKQKGIGIKFILQSSKWNVESAKLKKKKKGTKNVKFSPPKYNSSNSEENVEISLIVKSLK